MAAPVEQLAARAAAELREKATRLPSDGPPVVRLARERAMQAVEAAAAALGTDPTLTDNPRDIDLLAEILRQLKPLARQAEVELRRRALEASSAPTREIARLGRTNPLALEELDALSRRCQEIAERVTAAAQPDWNTPGRIRERSERLLPDPDTLEDIADELRRAVRPALELEYPTAEAVRLAALADEISGEPSLWTDAHGKPTCLRRAGTAETPLTVLTLTARCTSAVSPGGG